MSTLVHQLNRLLMFDAPWAWTETCQEAFKKLKELLLNSPLLAHYDPNKPVRLAVEASSFGLGAVSDDGEEKPIGYVSLNLSASEQSYSMIEKEALAIESDEVNRVQMERAPITVSQIREATRGDPVLSLAMHCILNGWPAEKCIPDELKIYYNKQDELPLKMAASSVVLKQ